jgi:LmbE family N-acetylglucosaminyl deacetylase
MGGNNMQYYNLRDRTKSSDITHLFPDWDHGNERVAVLSPHDDDAVIGAGGLICTAMENGAQVYVFIFCNGDGGYSDIKLKDTIVGIRAKETVNAYKALGLPEDHVVRFDLSDFSVKPYIGWKMPWGKVGIDYYNIKKLREFKITRVLIPNGYKEHADHEAVHYVGFYDSPQTGDPILMDWGKPSVIKSTMVYSVWSDFTPEDAVLNKADFSIRANKAIKYPKDTEDRIRQAIRQWASQGEIIKDLVARREERLCNDGYIELYLDVDPRPKLKYEPYIQMIRDMDR